MLRPNPNGIPLWEQPKDWFSYQRAIDCGRVERADRLRDDSVRRDLLLGFVSVRLAVPSTVTRSMCRRCLTAGDVRSMTLNIYDAEIDRVIATAGGFPAAFE